MKLSTFTALAFQTNAVLDSCPNLSLDFNEIYDAADQGRLVQLLAARFGEWADFSLLLIDPSELRDANSALTDAAGGLYGRVEVTSNGLCLVLAIVLEAIQQQFIPLGVTENEPEPPSPDFHD